jgi:predicted transcriptional regulator
LATDEASTHRRGVALPGLKAARHRKALTQRELASLAGVGESTISDLEVGNRGAYMMTMRRLSEALEESVIALTQK